MQTRRQFIKEAIAIPALLAAACPGASARADVPGAATSNASPGPPMSIARWKAPPDAAPDAVKNAAIKLTEQAIADLGGMNRFVKRGDSVWIKPNIGFRKEPETAANTNPDVVATLVRLCLNAGAKQVNVGDNSCYGARMAYPMSGIEAAAIAAGGTVRYLDGSPPKDVDLNGDRLAFWPIYTDIVECDLVINAPVLKHHIISGYSACLKNYMGVAGGPRHFWHKDLPTCLADMAAYMKPRLCVLDAVRVIAEHGPSGGDLSDVKLMGLVAAGTDLVALDAFGAEQLGLDPAASKAMAKAQARGLGQIDYRALLPRETEIA